MDLVQDNSSQDNHVALNAADGTKSQELTYSYQNGLHTFSIPLKEAKPGGNDGLHSNNTSTASTNVQHTTGRKDTPVDYHLVEAVSFELAPTGFSKAGESQEYTLVPTGSKPFGFQVQDVLSTNSSSVQDVTSSVKAGKRKRDNDDMTNSAKKIKPVLGKSKRQTYF